MRGYQSANEAVRSIPFGEVTSRMLRRDAGVRRPNPTTPELAAAPLITSGERGQPNSPQPERSHGELARRRAIRRFVVFVIVILVHIAVIYWVVLGLMTRSVEADAPAVEVTMIFEARPQDPLPPQPTVVMQPPPAIYVPAPLVNIQLPEEDSVQATYIPPLPQSNVAAAPAQSQTAKVPVQVGASFLHAVDLSKYYPGESRRAAEQGVVTLRVCVNTDGRYDGPPLIIGSSGFPRLDKAGVDMVLDNKMRPGTLDGVPVHSCESLTIQFQMH